MNLPAAKLGDLVVVIKEHLQKKQQSYLFGHVIQVTKKNDHNHYNIYWDNDVAYWYNEAEVMAFRETLRYIRSTG